MTCKILRLLPCSSTTVGFIKTPKQGADDIVATGDVVGQATPQPYARGSPKKMYIVRYNFNFHTSTAKRLNRKKGEVGGFAVCRTKVVGLILYPSNFIFHIAIIIRRQTRYTSVAPVVVMFLYVGNLYTS